MSLALAWFAPDLTCYRQPTAASLGHAESATPTPVSTHTSFRASPSYVSHIASPSDSRVHALNADWTPATRILFRFIFVYFVLFIINTQLLTAWVPYPLLDVPDVAALPPMRNMLLWIGTHLLGITYPILYEETGSGDKTLDWILLLTIFVTSVVAASAWTLAAKRARNHEQLYKWFRLVVRMLLATTMLSYGWAKLVPLQMPILDLRRLVQPYGTMSPMGVLWSFIGSSPTYEIFVGSIEVVSGCLLFWPRTVTLAALLCLMDAIQIFSLNMMYDVPVKILSFHLILLSLFLLGPNLRRLFDLLILNRTVTLKAEPSIVRTSAAKRNALIAQLAYGTLMLGVGVASGAKGWKLYGGGAPTSELFGIWNVEQMTVDGVVRPPLHTDSTRWRRAIFQSPGAMRFQRLDDRFLSYRATIDTTKKTLLLAPFDSTKAKSPLTYDRPSHERLLIDGTLEGHHVHMELAYVDPDSFLQRSRGFHFVNDVPFNR
jgi:hypothetical protein